MNLEEQKNIPNIFDILRAIAIFMVFICHNVAVAGGFLPTLVSSYPKYFYMPAWGGVWIFFILSGYLIGKGFYNQKYNTDWKGILNFVFRRFLRLIPLYWFFLLLIFVFVNPAPFFTSEGLSYFIFTNNFREGSSAQLGALWFISTIFQLYILAPIIYKFFISRIKSKHVIFLAIIVILGLVERLLQNHYGCKWYTVTYVNPLSNLDLFFGGFILNALVLAKDKIYKYPKFVLFCKIVSFVALFAIIAVNINYYYINQEWSIWRYQYIFPTLYLISTLFIIWSYDTKNRVFYAPLTLQNMIKNPLRFIEGFGVISFVFYIFHSTILQTFAKQFASLLGGGGIHYALLNGAIRINISAETQVIWSMLIFGFIFSIIWSIIIFNIIEKPASKLKDFKLLNKE